MKLKILKSIITVCICIVSSSLYSVPYAYVTTDAGFMKVVNLTTKSVEATVAVGQNPRCIALTPDGTKAYVTDQLDNTVTAIDLTDLTATPVTISVGLSPEGIAVSPDGQMVYVVNVGDYSTSQNSSVTPIVVATNAPQTAVEVMTLPAYALSIVISPDGQTAYVGSGDGSVVSVLDLTDPLVPVLGPDQIYLGTGSANASKMAITSDGSTLYTGSPGNDIITVSDTQLSPPADATQFSDTGGFFIGVDGMAITPDNTKAYLSDSNGQRLFSFSGGTFQYETFITTPLGVAINLEGTTAYVADYSQGIVPVDITTTPGTVKTAIPLSGGARALALFGADPITTLSGIGTLSKNIFLNRTELVLTLASNPLSLTGNVLYQLYNNDVLVAATRMNNPLLFEIGVSLSLPLNINVKATAEDGSIETATITITNDLG